MIIEDFADFVEAIHGYRPFPWQVELLRRAAEGRWPDVLALPTSAGKTLAIDIAVFALALDAARPRMERLAPLRTFFIIDRRLVVDEAAQHAGCLAARLREALNDAGGEPIVREVAGRLATLGGTRRQVPLHVATLRGGMYRDDSWAQTPHQPMICVSTVDQVGSRLLFRGYGLSPYQWPVHAGLIANDALLIVDEAHLSEPFFQTLRWVQGYRQLAQRPLRAPFHVVRMSATICQGEDDESRPPEVLSLDAVTDHTHPVLAKRLFAEKTAHLEEAREDGFEKAVVELADGFCKDPEVRVIGVVVNRVASARDIFERIRHVSDAILLTGRIRPFDRDRLLERWLPAIKANRTSERERPLFVVATQTIEVGANLDFDALVTEAAPLDALRQRFGRLNRMGHARRSRAAIVLRKGRGEDRIYGSPLAATWAWLQEQGEPDFGILALDRLLSREPVRLRTLLSAPARAPTMLPSHVDAWSQTSPAPGADPDPAPFLHGRQDRPLADVLVVWRRDLPTPESDDEERWQEAARRWKDIVALAPPLTTEAMPLPLPMVRAWLTDVAGKVVDAVDLEGVAPEPGPMKPGPRDRYVLRWRGPDDDESLPISPGEIRPGDTLVVPTSYGGVDEFGWNQMATPAVDIADACANLRAMAAPAHAWGRRRLIFRMPQEEVPEGLWAALSAWAQGGPADDPDGLDQGSRAFLQQREPLPGMAQALEESRLREPPFFYPGNRGTWMLLGLVLEKEPAPVATLSPLAFTDDDDSSSLTGPSVSLTEHSDGVRHLARDFAMACGLPDAIVSDVALAAWLHDLGKADPRMQTWLYGGDEIRAASGKLLAKSGMDPANRRVWREARSRSRYPKGARHEFLSVALASGGDALREARDLDLVLHLIGTHHGRGRPFVPAIPDHAPEDVAVELGGYGFSASSAHRLERIDSGWSDRFWRLSRRYGPWGLAWLEAIVRLADRQRSAEEAKR